MEKLLYRISPKWEHYILGIILLLLVCVNSANAQPENISDYSRSFCKDGLIIPSWQPIQDLSTGDKVTRAIVYFLSMVWLFIGVSIIVNRFMGAIEVITSQEKAVKVKKANGDTQIIMVRVWNETVANLTLMALGSSAPKILLPLIEVFGNNFEAGDLGPGTILGSAAFNLLAIIGICVYVIPDGEARYIKHLPIFFVSFVLSIFAYVWLYIMLTVISYGIIHYWEALIAFIFFPVTVIWAYAADRELLVYKYLPKEYRISKRGVIVEFEGADLELGNNKQDPQTIIDDNVHETVKEFMSVIRELRQKNPEVSIETFESIARNEIINRGPKSRAFYRIRATKKLTVGGNIMKDFRDETKHELKLDEIKVKKNNDIMRVYFYPGLYTIRKIVGSYDLTVKREGGELNSTVLVDYKTEHRTANSDVDYISAEGTLVFLPHETIKTFSLEVIEDDELEDEYFSVRLSNIRFCSPDGTVVAHDFIGVAGQPSKQNKLELTEPFLATIMILDNNHGGIFIVSEKNSEIVETIGTYELKILRISGARGRVSISYSTNDGTAKAGKDYKKVEGKLIFESNETERIVEIKIMEEDSYEKDVFFYLDIGEPEVEGGVLKGFEFENKGKDDLTEDKKIALLSRPKLGPNTRCQIRITENKEYKNMVDKLVKQANESLLVGPSSWMEQFSEATTVGGDEQNSPSCGDYVMHVITVFWKVIFSFVPPTDHYNGWPCFFVSIALIGLLTTLIGDVASHFGCTIGLTDSITAISIVAIGTSVPDAFASKIAAQQDRYADASVGIATISIGVNVFLGIGLVWTMAASYHSNHGYNFMVQPENLAFPAALFCVEALVAIAILMIRRHPKIGGELGGPEPYKSITSYFFYFLWIFFIVMSTLEAYGYSDPFFLNF